MSDTRAPVLDRADGELLTLLYDRLHDLAERHMHAERAGHTLQPTALVHEAYIRLAARQQDFNGRLHFMRAAAGVMRRVLVDHARSHDTLKRGGGWSRQDLDGLALGEGVAAIDVLALDEALTRLERLNPRHARIVELRFYAGLTEQEVAEVLGCSLASVEKGWRAAKAWLHAKLSC